MKPRFSEETPQEDFKAAGNGAWLLGASYGEDLGASEQRSHLSDQLAEQPQAGGCRVTPRLEQPQVGVAVEQNGFPLNQRLNDDNVGTVSVSTTIGSNVVPNNVNSSCNITPNSGNAGNSLSNSVSCGRSMNAPGAIVAEEDITMDMLDDVLSKLDEPEAVFKSRLENQLEKEKGLLHNTSSCGGSSNRRIARSASSSPSLSSNCPSVGEGSCHGSVSTNRPSDLSLAARRVAKNRRLSIKRKSAVDSQKR